MKRLLIGLLLLSLFTTCKVNHLLETKPTVSYRLTPPIPSEQSEDQDILDLIQPYKTQLDAEMNTVVGTADMDLTKGQPESTIGNWFADLVLEQSEQKLGSKVDFAIVNQGGIRINSIPKGPVTKGKLFELMPFDNRAVVLEVSGTTITLLFDLMAQRGGWPISRGVKYEIVDGRAVNVTIEQQSIIPNKTYKIALSDYIANGGSDCDFLKPYTQIDLNINLRDMILEYVSDQTAQGKTLTTQLEQRVTIIH